MENLDTDLLWLGFGLFIFAMILVSIVYKYIDKDD